MEFEPTEFEFDSALKQMKGLILSKEGVISAQTLTMLASVVHGQTNKLRKLSTTLNEMKDLLEVLNANRNDLGKCLGHVRAKTSMISWVWEFFGGDKTKLNCEDHFSSIDEFNKVLEKLSTKHRELEAEIQKIQTGLDLIGLGVIMINAYMLIDGIGSYVRDSGTVEQFRHELTDILDRAEKAKQWWEGSNPSERERMHFRGFLVETTCKLAIIETKLSALRDANSNSGFKHLLVGAGTVALTAFLPVTAPVWWGMLGTGSLNSLCTGLNWHVVGKIDKLLPIISEIRSMLRECGKLSTGGTDLPEF